MCFARADAGKTKQNTTQPISAKSKEKHVNVFETQMICACLQCMRQQNIGYSFSIINLNREYFTIYDVYRRCRYRRRRCRRRRHINFVYLVSLWFCSLTASYWHSGMNIVNFWMFCVCK